MAGPIVCVGNKVEGCTKSTAGDWKLRKLKKGKGSMTTGKSKGIVASTLQKYMCRRNRSWKHPLYGVIMGHGEFTRSGKKT